MKRLVEALEGVAAHPRACPIVYKRDVRRAQLKKFVYGVFYRVLPHVISVIAVTHLHRDPRVWQRRA